MSCRDVTFFCKHAWVLHVHRCAQNPIKHPHLGYNLVSYHLFKPNVHIFRNSTPCAHTRGVTLFAHRRNLYKLIVFIRIYGWNIVGKQSKFKIQNSKN
jgi:hypothetical protein